MKVVDLSKHRQEKIAANNAQSVKDASSALQDMKDDINVVINASIDALVAAGMSEDKAMMVVMTHLSDLVMGDDLETV